MRCRKSLSGHWDRWQVLYRRSDQYHFPRWWWTSTMSMTCWTTGTAHRPGLLGAPLMRGRCRTAWFLESVSVCHWRRLRACRVRVRVINLLLVLKELMHNSATKQRNNRCAQWLHSQREHIEAWLMESRRRRSRRTSSAETNQSIGGSPCPSAAARGYNASRERGAYCVNGCQRQWAGAVRRRRCRWNWCEWR